jgi:hypothetical protein
MVSHSSANSIIAEKRTRSTSAPTTSATVIAAKLIWKQANTARGSPCPASRRAQAESPSMPGQPRLGQVADERNCRRRKARL